MTDPCRKAEREAFAAPRPLLSPFPSPSLREPAAPMPRQADDPDGRTTDAWPEIAEMRTAHAIRRILDDGTEQLPARVTDRLASAREQALARVLDTPDPIRIRPSNRLVPESGKPIGLRWQLGALAVSAVMLASVFILVDTMKEEQSVEDLAEVDSALLTDDLPLDAWADRGFGVYLVNTRLPQQQAVSFNSRR